MTWLQFFGAYVVAATLAHLFPAQAAEFLKPWTSLIAARDDGRSDT